MHIPVNKITDKSVSGIAITRVNITADWIYNKLQDSHRDEYHLFLLQEEGSAELKVDFQTYRIEARSILCLHPNQVHQLGPFSPGKACFLIMDKEGLLPTQLKALDDMTPLTALPLEKEAFELISDTASICIRIYENSEREMYQSLVKESCNLLVGLFIAQYIRAQPNHDKLSRSEEITKAFRSLLEQNFITLRRPSDYADRLNISTPYLYECIKNVTGLSVSYHIEQRVILEAKRMLYYTDRSVKQIAADIGFSDYAYFTRLFAKVTGMTALAFRKKNV